MFGTTSPGISNLSFLDQLLGSPVKHCHRLCTKAGFTAILGWGRRPTTTKAISLAKRWNLPFIALEDGFLRSFGTGDHFPPLSLIVDDTGIYYDSTCPSSLENLLNSSSDVLADIKAEVLRAKSQILDNQLSKYNHAPDWAKGAYLAPDSFLPAEEKGVKRVLVVDQTMGDMSVSLGGANAATFSDMLAAALSENPQATIYIKTHPEVTSGRKGGYLTHIQNDERTVVLRQAINPLSLIKHMDKVYVVSSTMGFEALLAGKPVSCFGLPWYAGWGVTDDRQNCPRRKRRRNVDELFAAAYFHYTRYLNPKTHQLGTIFHVINWLIKQRETTAVYPGRMICVDYPRWKAVNVKPLLSLDLNLVRFAPNVKTAEALLPRRSDRFIHWGRDTPRALMKLAQHSGAQILRMEDGFVRSVGLGSDLIPPLSLVLDTRGIYFDPTQPSDLEHLLNTARFSAEELQRAHYVRNFIVEHGITKYNLEPCEKAIWPTDGKRVILVPGQVEDDASIRYGCTDIKTNPGLLQAARRANPDAFIVYKPHPDVMSHNRKGKLALRKAQELADHVELRLSIVSCIAACDEVHTMTSLAGFDALLRGKQVVVYGQPFYAGWGLTKDMLKEGIAFKRRQRRLMLDELVAGTLLRYPIYWDWELKGYTTCEAVLQRIMETRNALEANGGLEKLRKGIMRRQWRQLGILVRAWGTKI